MSYKEALSNLKSHQYTWLVTGAAGFIGSNLAEALIKLNQRVIAVDNFSTGYLHNIEEITRNFDAAEKKNFNFFEGDILDKNFLKSIFKDVDIVLHQAAIGSVVRSIEDPLETCKNNIEGFLNTINQAKNSSVKSFVYASSSSVYGDSADLPSIEDKLGACKSPYALSKLVNEMYADVFFTNYSFVSIGLRYFNVFGKRQDSDGAYAAVIPKWISRMIHNKQISIFGDGSTTRDFCYMDNVVQMNILAGLSVFDKNMIFNVGTHSQISLKELFDQLKLCLEENLAIKYSLEPHFKNFRDGDILHSLADVQLANRYLGYSPTHDLREGLRESIDWYYRYLH